MAIVNQFMQPTLVLAATQLDLPLLLEIVVLFDVLTMRDLGRGLVVSP